MTGKAPPAVADMCADPGKLPERDLAMLRRYEPVLRYTRGELFFPLPVEDYLGRAALFRRGGKSEELLAEPGSLDPAGLSAFGRAHPGEPLDLRYVRKPLDRRAYRQWRRRPGRPVFTASSGAAAVGLLARLIVVIIRLSLVLRGKVPGGYAAAAERSEPLLGNRRCHYYGHVSRDGGYLVLQYWFLYAMNDWRSTFGGVNDHEADWEQVTIFTAEHADGSVTPAWVAFSSHDETGRDLRRRWDDPDLERVGDHPVVYAGAGSHSGAYLPGEYLVTVSPNLPRWVDGMRRALARIIPWSSPGSAAIGIPYIDYHRGDGISVGPGQELEWTAALIGDSTPWVRDYRGLWGLDTRDPLGGERAPAGPRYERDQRVRQSWTQPVAWAALDSEAPTAADASALLQRRQAALVGQLATVDADIERARDDLRAARAVDQAMRRSPLAPGEEVAALHSRVDALRAEQARLRRALDATAAAVDTWPAQDVVHAHLRRRALPLAQTRTRWSRVVQVWASASATILLAALGVILLRGTYGLLVPALAVVGAMLVIEALLRGRLMQLVLSLAGCALALIIGWAVVSLVLGNVRTGAGLLLLLAASYMAGHTVIDGLRRR